MLRAVGKRKAREVAKACLDAFGYQYDGKKVDVAEIAKHKGIYEILLRPLEDQLSGMLIVKGSKAVIVANQSHTEARQRFSIAHELGHYLLHLKGNEEVFHRDERSSMGVNRQEIEANTFAAELLMPANELRQWASKNDIDLFTNYGNDRILAKAEELGVSVQALSIRLERLGIFGGDSW